MPDWFEAFFHCAEIVGTVAFAASGAMIAIDRELDMFGVLFLGITAAVGGGIVRDLFLGSIPPGAFRTSRRPAAEISKPSTEPAPAAQSSVSTRSCARPTALSVALDDTVTDENRASGALVNATSVEYPLPGRGTSLSSVLSENQRPAGGMVSGS